ncbi:MAG: DUF1731 domain-containing protein [Chitinophagaceae bacterium]|nr:DUF1731 domain-containing protein [Chitinophagaceae bacterium]
MDSIGLQPYKWMLKMGAWILGTETELLLKSLSILPTKMLESGCTLRHPVLKIAFKNIVVKMPRKKYRFF